MKPTTRWTCLVLLCALFALPLLASSRPVPAAASGKGGSAVGTQLASTLTQITGIAISPMLGVSALGAWKWWQAETPEQKAALPWYGDPKYWVLGLLVVGAVALKDGAGAALPPGWKKPLDVAETLENKLSGIVAAGAVIPFTMDTLTSALAGSGGGHAELLGSSGLAMIHERRGGHALDAAEVVARAQAGDAVAQQALAIHRDLLGYSFASLILALDPHVIVLGGGLSKLEQLYRDLPAAIAPYLFAGVRVPPILPPTFGDAGGARGAALLARQHSPSP